jgi:hypothetical protein
MSELRLQPLKRKTPKRHPSRLRVNPHKTRMRQPEIRLASLETTATTALAGSLGRSKDRLLHKTKELRAGRILVLPRL